MNKLQVYLPPASKKHTGYPFFSEKPDRLDVVGDVVMQFGLKINVGRSATVEELERAHSRAYIEHVRAISAKGKLSALMANTFSAYMQPYTRISQHTFEAASFAAGTACLAVEATLAENHQRSFCAVRPPGHHAGVSRGEGFCIFNNVAIAALCALSCQVQRIAIIDFDRHHGNGTEEIVSYCGEGKILFVSSFQEDCKYRHPHRYQDSPYIIGIPIPQRSDFSVVCDLYRAHAIEQLLKFEPELILISAGFDMHKSDPLTNLRLETQDFRSLTDMIVEVANQCCGGKIVSVLEGGYDLNALPKCVHQHLVSLNQ